MSRIVGFRTALAFGITLLVLAVGLMGAGPISSREEPVRTATLVASAEPNSCAPGDTLPFVNSSNVMDSGMEPLNPGGCKACKQQPWCGCTYQGHPRISCDPCCYQAYPYPICLS